MALVHADNFSIYGTNAGLLLNGVYADVNGALITDPDGVSSGRVFDNGNPLVNTSFTTLRHVFTGAASNTAGIAMRVWLATLPSNSVAVPWPMMFRDVSNNNVAVLRINTTGRIEVALTGGSVYTTTLPVVTANGWYHIEMKFTNVITSSQASFEVRVEGITVLTQTAVACTGSAAIAQVALGGSNNFGPTMPNWRAKDLVVWDSSGSYNNDFLGSVLVATLAPTSDISLNWTPSSGTNGWSILDNIPPVDTTYLSAPYNAGGPPFFPNPYVGVLSDLPVTATSVKGLITYVRAAKSDGGDGNLQIGLISDPTGTPATVLGANRPITVAQTYWRDIFEVDPKTSAPWLPPAVNAARIQLNRTA